MSFCFGFLLGIIVMMLEWFRETKNDGRDLYGNVLKSIRAIEDQLIDIETRLHAIKDAGKAGKVQ